MVSLLDLNTLKKKRKFLEFFFYKNSDSTCELRIIQDQNTEMLSLSVLKCSKYSKSQKRGKYFNTALNISMEWTWIFNEDQKTTWRRMRERCYRRAGKGSISRLHMMESHSLDLIKLEKSSIYLMQISFTWIYGFL